eukprot:10150730-Heterocapsa_arctica.AAC.1
MMKNIPTSTTERMRAISPDAEEMEEDVIMKYHETIIEEKIAVTMAQNRNFTEENMRVRQRASSSSNEDL